MEEFLTFPNPHLSTSIPTLDSLLVSLVDDQGSERYPIINPLTSDNFNDRLLGGLAITGLNRVRETLSSPYNVPEALSSRETWLRHLMEVLAGAHEGLRNAQQANADGHPDTFSDLNREEANTASSIYSVLTDLTDFFDLVNEPDDNSPKRTHCIRCIQSASLPTPSSIPDHITSLLLTSEFDARAARLSLLNDRIRTIIQEADDWCKAQTDALTAYFITHVTSSERSPSQLASALQATDPSFDRWAKNLGDELREYTRRIICNEVGQDTSDQRCVEVMETHMTEATRNAKAAVQKTQADIDADVERQTSTLRADALARIEAVKADLAIQFEQEALRLHRDHKVSLTNLSESHKLSSVIRTKDRPSPITTKTRRSRKRKAGMSAGPLQPGTLQLSEDSEAMATDDQLTDLEPSSPLPPPPSLPVSITAIIALDVTPK